eukprot:NODE_7735_length_746_cov_101.600321_g7121_i0.p1 GENE.NODE_7735_length_746_cov_101.600321_g7121_i0~~NODE_7735_length_746_cov_101.600321_g7121_i0.p1  ORF type:complete len:213 (-),score=31.92 NODE_7735_length_746_cov_101.600321_g7121_i0:106-690(-)
MLKLILIVLLPCVWCLGYLNSNLPVFPLNRLPTGHTVGQTDPRLIYPANYVQQLKPFHDYVLIKPIYAYGTYAKGIVVAVGDRVQNKKQLTEGKTVVVASTCVSLTAQGQYQFGVSLNNGNPYNLQTYAANFQPTYQTADQKANYVLCPEGWIIGTADVSNDWGLNRAFKYTSRFTKATDAIKSNPFPAGFFSS